MPRRSQRQKAPLGRRQARSAASPPVRPVRQSAARATDAIDAHVGGRVRLARKALDMTQEALAAQLGITFQQLQKYERGINRISASRLHHAASVLSVPVSFFFPEPEPALPLETGEAPPATEAMDFLGSIDGIELSRAFSRIQDGAVRKRVIELVRSIAEREDYGQEE